MSFLSIRGFLLWMISPFMERIHERKIRSLAARNAELFDKMMGVSRELDSDQPIQFNTYDDKSSMDDAWHSTVRSVLDSMNRAYPSDSIQKESRIEREKGAEDFSSAYGYFDSALLTNFLGRSNDAATLREVIRSLESSNKALVEPDLVEKLTKEISDEAQNNLIILPHSLSKTSLLRFLYEEDPRLKLLDEETYKTMMKYSTDEILARLSNQTPKKERLTLHILFSLFKLVIESRHEISERKTTLR